MFNQFWTLMVIYLALHASIDQANASDYVSGVSWVFRGSPQLNNTVLTFNTYDTLNLLCRATGNDEPRYYFTFAITKGSSAPTMMSIAEPGDYYVLTVTDAGTMVWNDFDGISAGYENIVIIPDGLSYGDYGYLAQYAFRYVNIGTLTTTDSGTYHCSVCYEDGGDADYFGTSGGLTIQVNTKAGQAASSRSKMNNLLTYSAIFMGASKLFF